jgi:hypothetical protein
MIPDYVSWLTAAIAIDRSRAQTGICSGVVVTSKTSRQHSFKLMNPLAATKLMPNMPKYHDEGTGR